MIDFTIPRNRWVACLDPTGCAIFPLCPVLFQFNGGRSSVGRAPDCDSGGRGFNPRRPPH